MKVRKLAAFLLIFALMLLQCVTVFAGQELDVNKSIAMRWSNASSVTLYLDFSNGIAECSGAIKAVTGTTSIKATFYLERKDGSVWSPVTSWSESSTSATLTLSETKAVSNGTYQLRVVATVTANGTTETVSTSVQKTY